jgi:RES domain-containing protein
MRFQLCTIRLPSRARLTRYCGTRAPRALVSSQEVGGAWLAAGKDLALLVPSVIVRQERNYVLNVRHAQFAQLVVGKPEAFSFDERLWRR